MAKKQLKKINQPKKYLQGGSNMGSVSMMRQNPYYVGQVNQNAAEENLASMQEQVMQNKQTAAQAKKEAKEQQQAELDQSTQQSAATLGKAAIADKKAGILGKFMLKNPKPIGNPNPFAFTQAPAQSIGTGTAIEGVGVLAPEYMPAAQAGLGTATDAGVGVLAPEFIAPAAEVGTGATTAANAGMMGANMSSLAASGIGAAAMIGGKIIQKRANDNSDYTFTTKEARGNLGGGALAGAGTGFSTGAMLGSAIPGIGNIVLGTAGALVGAGVGAIKARKENKAAEEEAKRLQREQAAVRGAYQSAFLNSRLTSADTGFGLNSSTNMNNQFTNQYQVAKTGGVKKVSGGQIVPIEGGAVEFVGRSHENGGITIDKNTEVEGGETMDQVAMNDNNKQDYIFSKYLKLGGKSFAQRHKEILKGSGSQADIQQLAAMQEKVAGRDSKQVAAYGGFHKYATGGAPCPDCPPGTICDPATGTCVPDEETNNSYDWQATGLEGFKAKQQSAAPAKQEPAGKQVSQADYDFYIREKNAKLADQQRQAAAKSGTSNAPALTQLPTPKFDPKGSMQDWARSESRAMLDKSMAESEAYDAEKKKAMDEYNSLADGTVQPYNYDPATGFFTPKESSGSAEWDTPMRVAYKDGKIELGSYGLPKTAYRESPEDIAALQKEGYFKKKNGDGTTDDWKEGAWKNGKFIEFKDNPAFAIEQGYEVPGYTPPAGVQPPANTQPAAQTTLADDIDKMWADKGYVKNADGDWVLPEESQQQGTAPAYTDPAGVKPATNTQPTAPNNVDPKGNKLPDGYVWDATLNAPVSVAATAASTNVKGANAPNATSSWDTQKASLIDEINASPDALIDPAYKGRLIANLNSPDPKVRDQAMYDFNIHSVTQVGQDVDPKASPAIPYSSAPGVVAPFGPTQTGATTGGSNAPLTDAEMFAPAAKRATSTSAAAGTPQTPEEKEAARLAGLPRLFMGASRKVDENTGEATVYTDKPLMGVGAMAGSRLGTATGSQKDLAKVTNNSYDQAWQNKADNLYTNQKDASGGGLSSSDAIKDRDKIAESNWGQKYGYKKGMSADEAKAAHGKFASDVKSLFANNPDEMLGYFQYIIDGGDPKNTGSYLGKDAEQIRNNLTKKGFIGADGRPIAGKEKEMAAYLETQATNNAVGPIHNALGSYTAERSATKIKLKEGEKKKDEVVTQELPKKYEPCPPGTYRSGDGSCKPVGDVPQGNRVSPTMLAGLGQLVPVGAALMNPYKIAPGIVGAPAVKGSLMPRMNLNQERASAIQQNVAYKNAVINQNAGPGALAAMQSANTKTNQQMMTIAKQEQDQNRQLAADEGKLGMQASMFNAENQQKTQMFNKEFNKDERRYRREDILGALDTGASRIAGIVKDDRAFKADERLANALDETGSYDRFTILEQLNKESKRKNSPYYGTTEAERRRIAAAMHKQLNPDGYVAMTEYNKLQEEKAKLEKEKEEAAKKNQAKFGGARQYVSRLGELKGVRGTKAKL